MSEFEYQVGDAGFGDPSGQDKYRHFLNLYGIERQSKVGTFTILGSNPEETYLSITGVGFQPDLIIITSQHEFGGGGGQQVVSVGGAAHGKQFGTKVDFASYLGGRTNWLTRYAWQSDTQIIPEIAEFNSFDSDGFTLNLPNPLLTSDADPDDVGVPYDLGCSYFAARGAGAYGCGTNLSPASNGSQAITGLGFKPSAILFFCAHCPTLARTNLGARYAFGGADDQGHEYTAWAGSGSEDIYSNSLERPKALSILADASGVSCFGGHGFCHGEIIAEATVASWDVDGFTLNWTVDSTWAEGFPQREYSWLAFEKAEIGRFVYNHTSADYFAGTHFPVPTSATPKGLVFYMNDLGTESLSQGDTEGCSLAIGYWGQDGVQNLTTWMDVSRGIGFGFGVPQPAAKIGTLHGAFGCWARAIGDFGVGEDIDTGSIVTPVEQFIFGMNFRSATRKNAGGRILHDRRPVG